MKLDFKMSKIFGAGLALLLFGSPALATTVTVSATGEGSCSSSTSSCNNTNPSVIAITLAGSTAAPIGNYSDWFAFNIPTLTGNITSATISIFNNPSNFSDLHTFYYLYEEPGVAFFSSITGGTFVGSTGVPLLGGELVSIGLNGDGLALLNASGGSQAFFGGFVPGAVGSGLDVQIFGYNPAPVATLDLEVSEAVPTPEPGGILLLGTGLGIVGALRRKWLK